MSSLTEVKSFPSILVLSYIVVDNESKILSMINSVKKVYYILAVWRVKPSLSVGLYVQSYLSGRKYLKGAFGFEDKRKAVFGLGRTTGMCKP